jgi:hypothetical protein
MKAILTVTMMTLALLGPMLPAQALDICNTMTEQQANQSPECVRWYFSCTTQLGKKPTTGPAALLTQRDRHKLLLELAFFRAEASCETFSYQEVLAAAQAHLLFAPPLPPSLPPPR